MSAIRISGKTLGALELPSFYARRFWIKLRCQGRLPFEIFPVILSRMDSYSKKVTNTHFARHGRIPTWFAGFGELGRPMKTLHHSKFNVLDASADILLTGVPDEIFELPSGLIFVGDYKTARYTGAQDDLLPMYEVQLNSYAFIAESIGLGKVGGLGLIYYEPFTGLTETLVDSVVSKGGFSMNFSAKLLTLPLDLSKIPPLLTRVREIFEMAKPPVGDNACKDCALLARLIAISSGCGDSPGVAS